MAAKTGRTDRQGRIRPDGYASWEDYFADRYSGDLLENRHNKSLHDFLLPYWQDYELARQEGRRPRVTEDPHLIEKVDMQVLSSILHRGLSDRMDGFELVPEDMSRLYKANEWVDSHLKYPGRKWKEGLRNILLTVFRVRSSENKLLDYREEETHLEKRATRLVYAALFGMALSNWAVGRTNITGIVLLTFFLMLFAIGVCGIRLAPRPPDRRYEVLFELAKLRWSVKVKPKSRTTRRWEEKNRKRNKGQDADVSRVEPLGKNGKVRIHGVEFPEAAVKKPLKTASIFKRNKKEHGIPKE